MIFKNIKWWDVFKIRDDNVPGGNCVRKETIHVSLTATSYFMKCIIIVMIVQKSAVSREFVFKIWRCLITYNLMLFFLTNMLYFIVMFACYIKGPGDFNLRQEYGLKFV